MSGGAVDGIIAYSKYYKNNSLLTGILLICTVSFILLLINDYGLSGVAFATFLAVVVFNIIRILFVYQKFRMIPYKLSHIFILLFGITAGSLGYILPELESLLLDLVVRGSIVVLIFTILIYISKVSKDTNDLINQGFAILKGKAR